MSADDPDLDARMRRAAEAAIDHFMSAPPFRVGPAAQQLFQTAFPMAAQAVNQVRAALLLIDAGLAFPPRPTPGARSSMRSPSSG